MALKIHSQEFLCTFHRWLTMLEAEYNGMTYQSSALAVGFALLVWSMCISIDRCPLRAAQSHARSSGYVCV